jgi:hypothetical protein
MAISQPEGDPMNSDEKSRIGQIAEEVRAIFEKRLKEEKLLPEGASVQQKWQITFSSPARGGKISSSGYQAPPVIRLVSEEVVVGEIQQAGGPAGAGVVPIGRIEVSSRSHARNFEYLEPARMSWEEVVMLLRYFRNQEHRNVLLHLLVKNGNEPYREEFGQLRPGNAVYVFANIPQINAKLRKMMIGKRMFILCTNREGNRGPIQSQVWEMRPTTPKT